MRTITAIIRVKPGSEQAMQEGLLDVAKNVQANEPQTLGFYVSRGKDDPCVFTTYERFASDAAMDAHNHSATVARFFGIAKPLLDGDVVLIVGEEVSAK